ncbi:DUF3987 domain-containing protein [Roseivirga misakiensis]|uniref:DUF3987 domain-containing protein n=1 Tax=Roseivirga misakiensis TaxID=1563681 RepID=A0A1E5T5R6_9BACT|nr:DUF3987 domain-containing protein [Roseivirga misakiensis]OEK06719.1 hypothetical protein BFP71_03390 [Roseivirga misakiensis]
MNNQDLPDFEQFLSENRKLATASEDELREELESRNLKKPFPLHVFNDKIKPYLDALHKEYDLPRSYIGLGLLCAYSTAIGTGYHVEIQKIGKIFLPIWACLEGISSSGKSLVMNQVFKPHLDRQKEYDDAWKTENLDSESSEADTPDLKQLIYRDSHVQTLIRYVMPSNPKGILKDADEILEWINGMNQLSRKEGTDEQFWMSAWNCKAYTAIRARNQKFHLSRPFVNVFGGIQPSVLHKIFKNDRDKTGFVFRLLFAVPEVIKIAEVNLEFDMPEEFESIHKSSINRLLDELEVGSDVDEYSKKVKLSSSAVRIYSQWSRNKQRMVNRLQDSSDKEIQAGIHGKIKEYCLRFSALLHLADISYTPGLRFGVLEEVEGSTMERAIELSEYFFESAINVSERVSNSVTAPVDVLRFASYSKAGFSFQKIGDLEFSKNSSTAASRKKLAERTIKKMIKDYPKIFNAVTK